jgi:hypothetical protein
MISTLALAKEDEPLKAIAVTILACSVTNGSPGAERSIIVDMEEY